MIRRVCVLLGSSIFVSIAACSSEAPVEEEDTESSSEALSADDAVARAEQWVAVKLKYCQAANGARDYDAACSTYCSRQKNAAWDPYRSDCSGLVSWAWGLPAPGRITTQFAPFKTDITKAIAASDLRPGDAINNTTHIMLFKSWVTPGKRARLLEEPGCSSAQPYAREDVSDVTISGNKITVASHGETFTAIRYGKLETKKPVPDASTADAPPDPSAPAATPAATPPPSYVPPSGNRASDDTGGCNVSSSPSSFTSPALLALVAVALRRRRRAMSPIGSS